MPVKARALNQDYGQDPPAKDGKLSCDLTAERFVDSLLATGRYHDTEGRLDAERLIADVRRIQVALALTGSKEAPRYG
jgi:hypothetical protein